MKSEKQLHHNFIFPMVLIYFEIMLRILNGTGVLLNLIYPILFGIGTGYACSVLASLFSEKVNRWIAFALLAVTGILFAGECLIYGSMQFYMPLGTIGTMTSDVTGNYLNQVVQTVTGSLPVLLIFLLPAILYLLYGKKYISAKKKAKKEFVTELVCAIAFFCIGVLWANVGNSSEKWKNQYQFDAATQTFGLVSSVQLDSVYEVFGNTSTDTFKEGTQNLYFTMGNQLQRLGYTGNAYHNGGFLPTLSNSFGLEYDSRLLAGRDVFSDAEPLVLWTNHAWVTKKGKYDSDTGTFYPNEGVVVDDAYVERIKSEVTNKLSFSGKVLDYDYYDILVGEK